jgi:hypothetical protein
MRFGTVLSIFVLSIVHRSTAFPPPTDGTPFLVRGGSSEVQTGGSSAGAPAVEWMFYASASSDYHRTQTSTLISNDWRIISLSAHGSPVVYDAVWVKRPYPAFTTIQDANWTEYNQFSNRLWPRGYGATLITVTGPAENATYAGVFEAIATPYRSLDCNMTKAEFGAEFARRIKVNFRLKSFSEYGAPDNRRYCAIWHENTAHIKCSISLTMSHSDFARRLNAERTKPYGYPAYVTESEDQQISALFADTSLGPWKSRWSINATTLETEYKNYAADGFYPIQIQGSDSGNNSRFIITYAKQDTPPPRQWTVNGPEPIDLGNNTRVMDTIDNRIMRPWMERTGVRQAQVAIGKGGTILVERAYTWAEPDRHRTTPTDRFLLADASTMFVFGCIQHLFETRQLNKTTLVYPLLGYTPADTRANNITVQLLLLHWAGFNSTRSGDPINWFRKVAQERGSQVPTSTRDLIEYVARRPLDFTPEWGTEYSIYGYLLLMHLVERVTGMNFYDYLRTNLLEGLDVVPYSTDPSLHANDPVFQETSLVGPDAGNPASDLLVSAVYGGDGVYKDASIGAVALSSSASSVVKYISSHG